MRVEIFYKGSKACIRVRRKGEIFSKQGICDFALPEKHNCGRRCERSEYNEYTLKNKVLSRVLKNTGPVGRDVKFCDEHLPSDCKEKLQSLVTEYAKERS